MTLKPPGSPNTPTQLSVFEVIRESPLNILDPRFAGDNTGLLDNTAALEAVNAYVGTYGAEVIFPAGEYLFESNPVIDKNAIHLRGIGRPLITCEKLIVQADDFAMESFQFEERAGVVAGNGRAIYVDPDTAGRDLTGFRLVDLLMTDFFYAVDFRGSTHMIIDIVCEDVLSERVASGNAGHLNFFNVENVETRGCGARGGQNSASQNFGNGAGVIRVVGGMDRDNDVSGGGLNFENFFASAKVVVDGGVWGWDTASSGDYYAITVDDVEDVQLNGVDSYGRIRIQTSSGSVKRVKVSGGFAARLQVLGAGAPVAIDDLEVSNLTLRGVPGSVNTLSAFNLDGTYLKRARLFGNKVMRFAADGVTENWANAVSVARGANLNLSMDGNDFGGRPITASGSIGTGIIDFGPNNINYGSLTNIVKTPVAVPAKAGTPVDADYDSTTLLRNGSTAFDSSGVRMESRVGTTWFGAQMGSTGTQTVATDADFTITQPSSPQTIFHTGTLTAARTVTVSNTNAAAGMTFRIVRTGAGAFNLNIGSGPLKALATNQWAEVTHDGSAWKLTAFGSL